MFPKKISKKKLERQLSEQTSRERICALALCHKVAVTQVGDLSLCGEHKDCMPTLPFGLEIEKGV